MIEKINILKALADENRLNIITMLSCGEMCVCDIIEKLDLTQPTISHHLKTLERAGLVGYRKEGKWRYYFLEKQIFDETSDFIKELSEEKENCICKIGNSICNEFDKLSENK